MLMKFHLRFLCKRQKLILVKRRKKKHAKRHKRKARREPQTWVQSARCNMSCVNLGEVQTQLSNFSWFFFFVVNSACGHFFLSFFFRKSRARTQAVWSSLTFNPTVQDSSTAEPSSQSFLSRQVPCLYCFHPSGRIFLAPAVWVFYKRLCLIKEQAASQRTCLIPDLPRLFLSFSFSLHTCTMTMHEQWVGLTFSIQPT